VTTVHVQNTVRDFDAWKASFDKYEDFRAEQGVQSYRVSRDVAEPQRVMVDLEFSDEATASAFLPQLAKVMNSPQAQEQIVQHERPRLYTIVTDKVPGR
jgi:quinol monooxygenase YgiN